MYNLILLLVLVVLILDTRKEGFKNKSASIPIHQVLINDPTPNMSGM